MVICVMFITIGLLEVVLTRSIPPYELCMERCGEDPPRREVWRFRRVEMCRDRCNREERIRCLAAHPNSKREKRKCWKAARDRCIERCGNYLGCIQICRQINTPPAQ
ncbi:hypothetical protein CRM22_010599 [Opisthorchis felineus]|uniref:Uncharacterized protein n=1 Tax=Opisthorchis felineus TaxID=147828 RepID=A0A4S2KRG4_OPIFE|nr:hypothetical protein CRM22_010599 [Opisthorchis felineus]